MTRLIGPEEVRRLISFEDLIEPVSRAFQDSSRGRAQNGVLTMFPGDTQEAGDVLVKTGVIQGHKLYVVKAAPWFALNAKTGKPQGGFLVACDAETGRTLAVIDDQHYLSDIRTAAAGALAARVLAPAEIDRAAVLGSGVQAYWQARALRREREFCTLTIWARNSAKAETLRQRLTPHLKGVTITVSEDLERTIREADVLVTATQAREPLVRGAWLRPGQHVTAVGADDSTKCELDAKVLHRARVFVDEVDANLKAGDIHRVISSEEFTREHIAGELGEVLAGSARGRTSHAEITVAKLVGIGAQDVVAAEATLEKLGIF